MSSDVEDGTFILRDSSDSDPEANKFLTISVKREFKLEWVLNIKY